MLRLAALALGFVAMLVFVIGMLCALLGAQVVEAAIAWLQL